MIIYVHINYIKDMNMNANQIQLLNAMNEQRK